MPESILDYLRIGLYAVLIGLGLLLVEAWNKDHPPTNDVPSTVTASPTSGHYIPSQAAAPATTATSQTTNAMTTAPAASAVTAHPLVTVTTDVLAVTIDTQGGDIVQVNLLKYPESLGSKTPFLLLNNDAKTRYLAQSGLVSQVGPDTSTDQATYTVEQTAYRLNPNDNSLTVKLFWQNRAGLRVTKLFTFKRNSYQINVDYFVNNQSANPWQGSLYAELMRTNTPPVSHSGMMNLTTYFGAAISSPDKPFEKISFKQMQQANLNKVAHGGWEAMVQHYFISAWVPPTDTVSTYYSRITTDGLYTIGLIGQPVTVAPGASQTMTTRFYAGPAIADLLEKTAPGLKLTIDYGWFWFISGIIFWMMQHIYNVVGNWGWSIVLVTVIIKLLFYKLSAKSYRSMSVLKKLQPRIEQLKERYGNDKQKMTQATLELYREEKVNPMSGCLPILIQIPVFIALYWVLVESVQLRQAPFILWIHDLSQHDPYYILPVMMGISMFIQQRLNPPPPDPVQAKLMMLMPIIFTALFANFPAGLMLYWFVNNTLSFLQQWYIMKTINQQKVTVIPKKKAKAT